MSYQYLIHRINELSEEDRLALTEQLIQEVTKDPEASTEQYALELLSSYTEAAKERFEQFGKMQGTSTGYPRLDELTKGLVGGEMTVIAGKTSYGKTTLAINIANKVALADTPVLFVTLEMTKAEIASRFMNINGGDTEDYAQVSSMISLQVSDELDWKSIDGLIENFINQFQNGLVIIDHLHYFTRELANVAEDLGRITKELKKNAVRHNVPVILISHVRKTGRDESAGIDELRGSSYIAQDADIVLMVGRDSDDQHSLLVRIEKNRNRGYDYSDNVAEMYLDGIKISNNAPSDINYKSVFDK